MNSLVNVWALRKRHASAVDLADVYTRLCEGNYDKESALRHTKGRAAMLASLLRKDYKTWTGLERPDKFISPRLSVKWLREVAERKSYVYSFFGSLELVETSHVEVSHLFSRDLEILRVAYWLTK